MVLDDNRFQPMYDRLEDVKLKRGDIFLSSNPMKLGKIINAWQALYARDKESHYSHAGIILDEKGTTYEALWTVSEQNLFEAYDGDDIIIGRPNNLSTEDIERGLEAVFEHRGQWYPFFRLLLFLLPPLVRRLPGRKLVCSEIVCKYPNKAGMDDIVYLGKMPDDIEEMIVYHKDFDIVYKGKNIRIG